MRPDVICVDPPRKGLAPAVVDTIVRMAPRRVVYVSCDPGTLARDIARFREQGWSVRRALAVDMFPRTAHVETAVLLLPDAGPQGDGGEPYAGEPPCPAVR